MSHYIAFAMNFSAFAAVCYIFRMPTLPWNHIDWSRPKTCTWKTIQVNRTTKQWAPSNIGAYISVHTKSPHPPHEPFPILVILQIQMKMIIVFQSLMNSNEFFDCSILQFTHSSNEGELAKNNQNEYLSNSQNLELMAHSTFLASFFCWFHCFAIVKFTHIRFNFDSSLYERSFNYKRKKK